ncbi:DinB family protein [Rubrivirga sp. IMCC43871]|uniref:DinB family protein n=1 Tax=Rubrivirga sp. IMCC43871 TaxID=3391575 RepID=UPI0039901E5F
MTTLRTLAVLSLCLFAGASAASAQDSPVTASLKGLHGITAGNLMATAEQLDEAMYAYQPADSVRTAGQILAHVANAQYAFCAAAAGEESPNEANFEETLSAKADIVVALGTALAYCEGVYDAMTDAQGAEIQSFFGTPMAASAILAFNSAHNYEHYGNLVTYMRINGMVPPSSQP